MKVWQGRTHALPHELLCDEGQAGRQCDGVMRRALKAGVVLALHQEASIWRPDGCTPKHPSRCLACARQGRHHHQLRADSLAIFCIYDHGHVSRKTSLSLQAVSMHATLKNLMEKAALIRCSMMGHATTVCTLACAMGLHSMHAWQLQSMQRSMTDLNVERRLQGADVLPKGCCLVPSHRCQVSIHVPLISNIVEAFTMPDEMDCFGAPLRHQLQLVWIAGI